MTASDKLFFWLFQSHLDRILQLQEDLPCEAGGYRFSAPVLKEREYRLDGLFLPPPLLRMLALLVQTEADLPATTAAIRAQVAGTALEAEIADGIAAILVSRFSGRSIPEICAMGGITLEDFTQSVAYREIYGLGRQEGRQEGQTEGRRQGELAMALRLLHRRCGELSAEQDARIRQLPLQRLEALAEALLDFQGPEDLDAWLAAGR